MRDHTPTSTLAAPPAATEELGIETRPPFSGAERSNRMLLAVLGAVAVMLIGLVAVWQVPAFDLWWQLKTGELILQSHSIPRADVFSHTAAGDPWVVQEWLTEIVLYLLYSHVTPEALVVFKIAAVCAAFTLVLWRCWARTRQPFVSVGFTVLAAYAARQFFDMRPQVLTYLFLAFLLLALDQWRLGRWPRVVWAIPPLMLLWVNCHSGFAIGLVVLAVETVAAGAEAWVQGRGRDLRWRTLAGVLGASLVAGLLNPYGVGAYIYPITLLSHSDAMNQVLEWLSPNFHLAWLRPYEALLILAMIGWGASTRPRRTADVILVLGLVQASLFSTRHMPIFAIVCAPIVAEHVGCGAARVQERLTRGALRCVPLGLAGAAVALAALLFQIRQEWQRLPARNWFAYCADLASFPDGALDFIRAHPGTGNLFNEYTWGGYCLYRLYPEQKIFMDGRAEVYFNKAFGDYSRIINLQEGWGDLLDTWHIDTILLPIASPLANALPQIGEWDIAYQDAKSVVFRRRAGGGKS